MAYIEEEDSPPIRRQHPGQLGGVNAAVEGQMTEEQIQTEASAIVVRAGQPYGDGPTAPPKPIEQDMQEEFQQQQPYRASASPAPSRPLAQQDLVQPPPPEDSPIGAPAHPGEAPEYKGPKTPDGWSVRFKEGPEGPYGGMGEESLVNKNVEKAASELKLLESKRPGLPDRVSTGTGVLNFEIRVTPGWYDKPEGHSQIVSPELEESESKLQSKLSERLDDKGNLILPELSLGGNIVIEEKDGEQLLTINDPEQDAMQKRYETLLLDFETKLEDYNKKEKEFKEFENVILKAGGVEFSSTEIINARNSLANQLNKQASELNALREDDSELVTSMNDFIDRQETNASEVQLFSSNMNIWKKELEPLELDFSEKRTAFKENVDNFIDAQSDWGKKYQLAANRFNHGNIVAKTSFNKWQKGVDAFNTKLEDWNSQANVWNTWVDTQQPVFSTPELDKEHKERSGGFYQEIIVSPSGKSAAQMNIGGFYQGGNRLVTLTEHTAKEFGGIDVLKEQGFELGDQVIAPPRRSPTPVIGDEIWTDPHTGLRIDVKKSGLKTNKETTGEPTVEQMIFHQDQSPEAVAAYKKMRDAGDDVPMLLFRGTTPRAVSIIGQEALEPGEIERIHGIPIDAFKDTVSGGMILQLHRWDKERAWDKFGPAAGIARGFASFAAHVFTGVETVVTIDPKTGKPIMGKEELPDAFTAGVALLAPGTGDVVVGRTGDRSQSLTGGIIKPQGGMRLGSEAELQYYKKAGLGAILGAIAGEYIIGRAIGLAGKVVPLGTKLGQLGRATKITPVVSFAAKGSLDLTRWGAGKGISIAGKGLKKYSPKPRQVTKIHKIKDEVFGPTQRGKGYRRKTRLSVAEEISVKKHGGLISVATYTPKAYRLGTHLEQLAAAVAPKARYTRRKWKSTPKELKAGSYGPIDPKTGKMEWIKGRDWKTGKQEFRKLDKGELLDEIEFIGGKGKRIIPARIQTTLVDELGKPLTRKQGKLAKQIDEGGFGNILGSSVKGSKFLRKAMSPAVVKETYESMVKAGAKEGVRKQIAPTRYPWHGGLFTYGKDKAYGNIYDYMRWERRPLTELSKADLAQTAVAAATMSPIGPVGRKGMFRLSPRQKQAWTPGGKTLPFESMAWGIDQPRLVRSRISAEHALQTKKSEMEYLKSEADVTEIYNIGDNSEEIAKKYYSIMQRKEIPFDDARNIFMRHEGQSWSVSPWSRIDQPGPLGKIGKRDPDTFRYFLAETKPKPGSEAEKAMLKKVKWLDSEIERLGKEPKSPKQTESLKKLKNEKQQTIERASARDDFIARTTTEENRAIFLDIAKKFEEKQLNKMKLDMTDSLIKHLDDRPGTASDWWKKSTDKQKRDYIEGVLDKTLQKRTLKVNAKDISGEPVKHPTVPGTKIPVTISAMTPDGKFDIRWNSKQFNEAGIKEFKIKTGIDLEHKELMSGKFTELIKKHPELDGLQTRWHDLDIKKISIEDSASPTGIRHEIHVSKINNDVGWSRGKHGEDLQKISHNIRDLDKQIVKQKSRIAIDTIAVNKLENEAWGKRLYGNKLANNVKRLEKAKQNLTALETTLNTNLDMYKGYGKQDYVFVESINNKTGDITRVLKKTGKPRYLDKKLKILPGEKTTKIKDVEYIPGEEKFDHRLNRLRKTEGHYQKVDKSKWTTSERQVTESDILTMKVDASENLISRIDRDTLKIYTATDSPLVASHKRVERFFNSDKHPNFKKLNTQEQFLKDNAGISSDGYMIPEDMWFRTFIERQAYGKHTKVVGFADAWEDLLLQRRLSKLKTPKTFDDISAKNIDDAIFVGKKKDVHAKTKKTHREWEKENNIKDKDTSLFEDRKAAEGAKSTDPSFPKHQKRYKKSSDDYYQDDTRTFKTQDEVDNAYKEWSSRQDNVDAAERAKFNAASDQQVLMLQKKGEYVKEGFMDERFGFDGKPGHVTASDHRSMQSFLLQDAKSVPKIKYRDTLGLDIKIRSSLDDITTSPRLKSKTITKQTGARSMKYAPFMKAFSVMKQPQEQKLIHEQKQDMEHILRPKPTPDVKVTPDIFVKITQRPPDVFPKVVPVTEQTTRQRLDLEDIIRLRPPGTQEKLDFEPKLRDRLDYWPGMKLIDVYEPKIPLEPALRTTDYEIPDHTIPKIPPPEGRDPPVLPPVPGGIPIWLGGGGLGGAARRGTKTGMFARQIKRDIGDLSIVGKKGIFSNMVGRAKRKK